MKALLIGATGLVGRLVLERLVASEHYSAVHVISRNPPHVRNAKIVHCQAGFDELLANPQPHDDIFNVDHLYSTLGTTIKTVGGDAAQFTKVDKTWPLAIAEEVKGRGARAVFVLSSVGANPYGASLYTRVKGELENAFQAMLFESCVVYQPSLLLGNRDGLGQKSRAGERAGQALLPLLKPLLRGGLRKYRGTPVSDIADKMVADGLHPPAGFTRQHFTGKG